MGDALRTTGAWLDVLGGAAQIGLALFLIGRRRRSPAAAAVACFFATNGLAFMLGNLVPREHPLFPLLRLTIWGALNWLAAAVLAVASIQLVRPVRQSVAAILTGAIVAVCLVLPGWSSAPESVTLLVFGGRAVYGSVAGLLALLVVRAASTATDPTHAAFLTAVLAINSGLHAGVGVAERASAYTAVHAALLLLVAVVWCWLARNRTRRSASIVAAAACSTPVLLGVGAALMLETERAVQDSGIYGLGRLAAVGLAAFALRRNYLFRSRREHGAASTPQMSLSG